MDTQVDSSTSYDGVMRAIHWTTLALVAGAFAAVWIADPALVGPYVRPVIQVHRSLGLTVAALTIFRLAWRWRARIPPLPGDLPMVQKIAARAAEGVLYVLLVAQPVIGLLYTNAYGLRVNLYFLGELPALIGRDRPLAAQLGNVHFFLGYSLLVLIGLHSAAALFHHFIRRDDVLNAMLPARLRGIGRSIFALRRSRRQT
ncbi:MAG TPA: cytochrome b [Stellaceae bacterium]|nr:cytochrome b [Stellaceae bacterium]